MGEEVSEVVDQTVENVSTNIQMSTLIPVIRDAVSGVFDIASAGFNFLFNNPLCAFMIGSGFAFSALGLVRKALRTAKRA